MATVGYLLVHRVWNTRAGDPVSETPSVDDTEFVRKGFEEEERRMLLRGELRQIVARAEAIRKDIDCLHEDIAACKQRLEDPIVLERAKDAMGDSVAQWYLESSSKLSPEHSANRWRTQLDTLLLPVEAGLSEKDAAFRVSRKLLDAIGLIESQVTAAKTQCARQRRMLDALTSMKDASAKDKGSVRSDGQNEGEVPSKRDAHQGEKLLEPSSESQE